jgi:aspartyl aminopeptidase
VSVIGCVMVGATEVAGWGPRDRHNSPMTSSRPGRLIAQDLATFIDASPSPYHAVETAARRLTDAGYAEVALGQPLPGPGRSFVRRGGTLVAWVAPPGPVRRFRVAGAHSDSPNLRLKPRPERFGPVGTRQVGVEVYGGVLLNSWLDRDLGLSGRVVVRAEGALAERLVRVDRPLLRIPQLAIHLDREVNEKGLVLNRQVHLAPLLGVGQGGGVLSILADAAEVALDDLVSWDVGLHDLTPSTLAGFDDELLSAPRIDNLLSCHAELAALLASDPPDETTALVVALFDHEEVGSTSDRGADGVFLTALLERIVAASGGDRPGYLAAAAASLCVSADGAHATHPNYPERHEPDHPIALNGGPVIKVNASVRYATDAPTAAAFVDACERAGVPHQWFVTRSDLACGSTIGPLTAAQLAMPTVDVGVAQLAMHSCREMAGADDPARLVAALGAFFAGA